jgi:hypothetical protein
MNAIDLVIATLPALVAAIIIFIGGYLFARLLRGITYTLLIKLGLEKLAESSGINVSLQNIDKQFTVSRFIAGLVYWLVLLLFFITAANTAGLSTLSSAIDRFLIFIPKIIAATFVFLLGLAAANIVKRLVFTNAQSMGFDFAKPIANFIYSLILLLAISLTINELEINTRLLDIIITVGLGTIGIAIAISLGLGSRRASENAIFSVYVSDAVKIGDNVILSDGRSGIVRKLGAVCAVIEQKNGNFLHVDNKEFLSGLTILSAE